MIDRTLVIIKPDAVARKMIGTITDRLEQKGLQLVGCKLLEMTDDLLRDHYSHLSDKAFFPRICKFMKSQPVILQCWEGKDAVSVVRSITGPTNGREAPAGTIRGDFSMSVQCNLVHASDSLETAKVEIERFFNASELVSYEQPLMYQVYAHDELP